MGQHRDLGTVHNLEADFEVTYLWHDVTKLITFNILRFFDDLLDLERLPLHAYQAVILPFKSSELLELRSLLDSLHDKVESLDSELQL